VEGQVAGPHTHRHRVRVKRKLTLGKRIRKALEMPQLKRRDRNQRVAIMGVVLFLLLYLAVLRPIIDFVFPPKLKIDRSAPAAPANRGPQQRKR